MFFAQARRLGDRPFLRAKSQGAYQPLSWRETADQVADLARGLRALGVQSGDRVGLVAENRPEWVIFDLAIISAGAITVPAYTTHTIEDHRYLLANSGASAVIVSTPALAQRVVPAADQVDGVKHVILLEAFEGQASATDIFRV